MKDGGSAGGMLQYDPNIDKQRVLSSMTLTNPIETFYTHGTFYKSTFTKNSNVTVTKNDNIYDETPNDTLQNTAVMLLGYTEMLLDVFPFIDGEIIPKIREASEARKAQLLAAAKATRKRGGYNGAKK
jgi:hypothetical protein